MKERLDGETFNKAYVAIPIKEGLLFDWIQRVNDHKSFYHMTIFFLGQINNSDLSKVKDALGFATQKVAGFSLTPEKLDFIGAKKDVFVLKVKKTDELSELREILEKSLPKKILLNSPFLPHITIKHASRGGFNKHEINRLMSIKDARQDIYTYCTDLIGVYYRTEENATALLYSQKYENISN